MTVLSEPPRAGNLFSRAINIILKPGATWDQIATEPATIPGLFTGYAAILALITPICSIFGGLVFTMPKLAALGFPITPSAIIIAAIVNYLLGLLAVYAYGMIINALAPTFGGVRDPVQAMKVAVYSCTPAWLCGIFLLVPTLAALSILGVYGLVLLWLGLPRLMRSPAAKTAGYEAVVVLCMIGVWIVLGVIGGAVGLATGATPTGMLGAMMHPHTTTTTSYTTTTP